MSWIQKRIELRPKSRGFHLISDEVISHLPELSTIDVGLLHLILQHTSASLSLNENADPTVRQDFEQYFSRAIPENEPYYKHTLEGADDLPAHIKSSIIGVSLLLPITNGALNLGCWQGIYLGEHRNHGGARTLLATLQGALSPPVHHKK